MPNAMQAYRVIVSGGGTGGHVFPAISIAQAFQRLEPSAQIHFVGAMGKIEMKVGALRSNPFCGCHGQNRNEPGSLGRLSDNRPVD